MIIFIFCCIVLKMLKLYKQLLFVAGTVQSFGLLLKPGNMERCCLSTESPSLYLCLFWFHCHSQKYFHMACYAVVEAVCVRGQTLRFKVHWLSNQFPQLILSSVSTRCCSGMYVLDCQVQFCPIFFLHLGPHGFILLGLFYFCWYWLANYQSDLRMCGL